jgi:hypothetical protein
MGGHRKMGEAGQGCRGSRQGDPPLQTREEKVFSGVDRVGQGAVMSDREGGHPLRSRGRAMGSHPSGPVRGDPPDPRDPRPGDPHDPENKEFSDVKIFGVRFPEGSGAGGSGTRAGPRGQPGS